MRPKDIVFSVNEYDRDGDVTDKGVFLHFGETRVKAADSIDDFRSIVQHMKTMVSEIEENYTHERRDA